MSCAAFKIEKSVNGGVDWAQIGTVPQGTTTYQATGIVSAQETQFRVRGYTGANNSDYSNIATRTCIQIPVALSDLTRTCGIAANTIVLNWQDNSWDEDGFKIYKSTDGIIFNYLASVLAGVTTYTATGIMPVQYYWFRVTAYNGTGESAYVQSEPLGCYTGGGGGLCGDSINGDPWKYLFKDARTGDILCN